MEIAKDQTRPYIIAWVLALIFYFLEYAVRSAPAVMIPELSVIFNVPAVQVSGIVGTYYYTYSLTALVAGIALDKSGAKYTVPAGLVILGAGCLLFAVPDTLAGNAGRLLQGAGSAFAFTGCVYLASRGFSPRVLATAIGFTQCLGMLGGSAGQFVVGPLVHSAISVADFWIYSGLASLLIAIALYAVTPQREATQGASAEELGLAGPYRIVFANGQSWLCGLISGLLFAPTTIFIMTWGVAFYQQDLHHTYRAATTISSMVPLGWVLGCPLLGSISDRLGRRKPVLMAGALFMVAMLLQILFLPQLFSPLSQQAAFWNRLRRSHDPLFSDQRGKPRLC